MEYQRHWLYFLGFGILIQWKFTFSFLIFRLCNDFLAQLCDRGLIHWVGFLWTVNCTGIYISFTIYYFFICFGLYVHASYSLASRSLSKSEADCVWGRMAATKIRHFQGGRSDFAILGQVQCRDCDCETHWASCVCAFPAASSNREYQLIIVMFRFCCCLAR
jgi:hypothetical protein